VTRGRLPQRAGLPGLNGGETAATVPQREQENYEGNNSKLNQVFTGKFLVDFYLPVAYKRYKQLFEGTEITCISHADIQC